VLLLRRDDHLAIKSQCPCYELDAGRGTRDRDRVPHADERGHALLELLNQRSVVGQPSALKGAADSLRETLGVADVGRTDVPRMREARLIAVNRERQRRQPSSAT